MVGGVWEWLVGCGSDWWGVGVVGGMEKVAEGTVDVEVGSSYSCGK